MHNLKTTLRNIYQNKFYTIINTLGLAIGLASVIFIILYLEDEITYDKHHEHYQRVYRLESDFTISERNQHVAKSPFPFGPAFLNEFSEVESFVRFREIDRTYFRNGENIIFSDMAFFTDSSVFQIFTHHFIWGSMEKALTDPNTVVLTQGFSKKLFGDENPVGKVLRLGNGLHCKITGVVQDPPKNSHLRFEALVSMVSYASIIGEQMYHGLNTKHFWAIRLFTYIMVRENANVDNIHKNFQPFYDKYMAEFGKKLSGSFKLVTSPLHKIHLHSKAGWDFPTGDIANVYIFSVIAIFLILIAAINYMNLATARSGGRGKEVGIRKVIGATRRQLIHLYLTESVLLSVFALIFGLFFVELFLPVINDLTDKELLLEFAGQEWLFAGILALTLIVGLISGSYPSFYLASIQPANVLRENISSGRKSGLLRKILITFQFTISIAMITATIIVSRQLTYMTKSELGFAKEELLVTYVNDTTFMNKLPVIKGELLKNPNILGVTSSLSTPGLGVYMDIMYIEGKDEMEEELMTMFNVDEDFIDVMKMEIVEGRNFDPEHRTDIDHAVLINQTAAKKFGWEENVLGRQIFRGHGKPNEYKVIGVVKDFHYRSLHEEIGPAVFFMNEEPNQYIGIKITSEDKEETLAYIESKWKQFNSGSPWEYTFLEDILSDMYTVENKLQKLISIFALISIFISLLGIFGLSSFITEQFTREISIRKVFGASVGSIIYKLSKDFIRLVLIAFLIAIPIAWYAMSHWLDHFPYRITIQTAWFIISGLFVLFVAELTMIFQALKAAYKNPVQALKYE